VPTVKPSVKSVKLVRAAVAKKAPAKAKKRK
jgi:hypothetical protein